MPDTAKKRASAAGEYYPTTVGLQQDDRQTSAGDYGGVLAEAPSFQQWLVVNLNILLGNGD